MRKVRELFPDGQMHHANAIFDVHRDMLFVETSRVFLHSIMQLPDGFDPDPCGLKVVAPTLDLAFIGDGIIPVACLMHITTRSEARPRGHTNRARCVRPVKSHALRRQAIQMWRFRQGMTRTT